MHDMGAVQKLAEFGPLVALIANERPTRVMEIGTFNGGTLWAWCQVAARDATLVSVDLPGGDWGGGTYDEATVRTYAREGQRLELIRADSHLESTRRSVESVLDGPLDFLFIDGDHTYDGAMLDYRQYAPLVKDHGYVAFHDIIEHVEVPEVQVHRVWDEIKRTRPFLELLDRRDVQHWGAWGGIGILGPG